MEIDKTKENKYTYDGVTNPLLSSKLRSRVDRSFVKDLEPKSFKIEKEFIMSDHFGLLISL